MKDHIVAECVNRLTAVATEFHDHQSLRERIRLTLLEAINEDYEWYRAYMALSVEPK